MVTIIEIFNQWKPIIIIIIVSKPIATIYKQKFPLEISKSLFERLLGLVLSLFELSDLLPRGLTRGTISVLNDDMYFVAPQPIIIIIIASKPMVTMATKGHTHTNILYLLLRLIAMVIWTRI